MPSLRERWRTFRNGIKSMVPMLELRPYHWIIPIGPLMTLVAWLLGGDGWPLLLFPAPVALVLHFDPPTPGDSWWAMHFTEAGLVVGPIWGPGVKDTN